MRAASPVERTGYPFSPCSGADLKRRRTVRSSLPTRFCVDPNAGAIGSYPNRAGPAFGGAAPEGGHSPHQPM